MALKYVTIAGIKDAQIYDDSDHPYAIETNGVINIDGGGSLSRHSQLQGLDQDDHPQYALRSPNIRFTAEGGLAVLLQNNTGATSVRGHVVKVSDAVDSAYTLQENEYDSIGVVYDAVANGQMGWVVVAGRAQVMLEDGAAASRGNLLIAAPTDGRALAIAAPGAGIPAADTHFKEIGHCTQTVSAGTNVLVWGILHFN